jgi:hypothetical protein
VGRDERRQRVLHVRAWTIQRRMTDEHHKFGAASKDSYSYNVGLYSDPRGGGDGQEDNVATPEVHQRGGDA